MTLQVNKNEWFSEFKACSTFKEQVFTSECRFYSYYATYRNVPDASKPNVPLSETVCDSWRMDSLFFEFRALSKSEQNLRATCFPSYKETSKKIPIDKSGSA